VPRGLAQEDERTERLPAHQLELPLDHLVAPGDLVHLLAAERRRERLEVVVVFAVVAHDLPHLVRLGEPDDQAVGLDHPDSYTNGGMTSESSLEAIRRVEEAPLAELVSVT